MTFDCAENRQHQLSIQPSLAWFFRHSDDASEQGVGKKIASTKNLVQC